MSKADPLETMYRSAMAELAHKPDPAKGKTAREWATLFSEWEKKRVGEQAARRRISDLLGAGKMIEDMDWRPFNGAMRKTPVYRLTNGKAAR